MRLRSCLLAVLVFFLAALPARAVKEWYDYYLEARDLIVDLERDTPKADRAPTVAKAREESYRKALVALHEARRLKPEPELNARTYSMWFVDYHPYYYEALCHLRLGDPNTAIRFFNIEADKGPVKKSALFRDLVRFRADAENARGQDIARRAREETSRLLREARELQKARKFDEALARLAEAQKAAENLDPQTRQDVQDLKDQVRTDEKGLADATARAQRLERALAEGSRLLEEDRPTDANVRFDEVLALDPRNERAREGKASAQARIRASTTRQDRERAFLEGKALVDQGQFEQALPPLTEAAADPANAAARALLKDAQSRLEALLRQKDERRQIDSLLAQAEQFLGSRHFSEGSVKLEAVLRLDPGNVRARQRLEFADRMIGDVILARWVPNQHPELAFLEPRGDSEPTEVPIEVETRGSTSAIAVETRGSTAAIIGVATDDFGIEKVEVRRVGSTAPPLLLGPPTGSGEFARHRRFDAKLPLEPGMNEFVVTATDSAGATQERVVRVTRRPHFWETRAFLPSALGGALGLVAVGFGAQQLRRRRAMRRRFNPYIAGAPVLADEMFFGRQKLMARMLNVLHHNSLMITGERRIGKTTFLYHLKKALAVDEGTEYRFFPVLIDLQGVPEPHFFHTVLSEVADTLELSPATRATLRFQPESEDYDGRDFSHDLQRVIEELKTRTPRKVKLALLIDEVDVLNEYSERINQRLRSIFMKTFSEHLVAIMSGVGIKRIWKSEGSPWYNFFDEIELSALSREEAEALIRTPVEGYFRFDPRAVEHILDLSGMKPYLVQKLCIHAVNRMLEQGRTRVSLADVQAAREVVRFEGGDDEEPAADTLAGRQASA